MRLAGLDADDAEAGSLGDQCVIGNDTVRDHEAHAEVLAHEQRALPLLDRLARDLAADRAHDEVTLQRVPRRLDRLRRDEERGHRPLVVDDAVAVNAVALDPRRVVELVEWIARRPHRVGPERRVEMRVEDQAVSPTRSVDPGRDIEALGDHRVLLRREPVLAKPLVDELAGGSLASGRTVDVPEREREVDDLLWVDALQDVVRRHGLAGRIRRRGLSNLIGCHTALPPWTGTANRATADAVSSIATDTRIAAWAFARSITAASRTGPTNAPMSAEKR
jgi:hypothetical protein